MECNVKSQLFLLLPILPPLKCYISILCGDWQFFSNKIVLLLLCSLFGFLSFAMCVSFLLFVVEELIYLLCYFSFFSRGKACNHRGILSPPFHLLFPGWMLGVYLPESSSQYFLMLYTYVIHTICIHHGFMLMFFCIVF